MWAPNVTLIERKDKQTPLGSFISEFVAFGTDTMRIRRSRKSSETLKTSYILMLICVIEFIMWVDPVVARANCVDECGATTEVEADINSAFAEYLWNDRLNFAQANQEKTSEIIEGVGKEMSSSEKQSQVHQQQEPLKSGSNKLVPPANWNTLMWGFVTTCAVVLGLTEGRVPKLGEVPDDVDAESDEPMRSNMVSPPRPMLVSPSQCNSTVSSSSRRTVGLHMNLTSATSNTLDSLSDDAILKMLEKGEIAEHQLENSMTDLTRAVEIRRKRLALVTGKGLDLSNLPFNGYDYEKVKGTCCENVVGYVPLPVGIAGPLKVNEEMYHVPMATTEGALVASTSRGCKALTVGGVSAVIVSRGMTRAPALQFANATRAAEFKAFVDSPKGLELIKQAFASTTRFGRVVSVDAKIVGRMVYLRLKAFTGDAMGMNMISKGVERVLKTLMSPEGGFEDMRVLALSGNYCTDKKPAAVNWILGRGRSVVCDAVVKGSVVRDVLKTTVDDLVETNVSKNLVGSAAAGSVGGFNAHAANILTAIYIATGQDPAQNVESSQCITLLEAVDGDDGEKDLYISCSMPCIEVGTIGGGTALPAQAACLDILGCKGASPTNLSPGMHGDRLAMVIASAVMAGELSLLSALATGDLVSSHMKLNRPKTTGPIIQSRL